MSRNHITKKCAAFIYDLKYEDIDSKTVEFTKKCLIDWMGCVLGGASQKPAAIIHKFADGIGGEPTSTMIGEFKKTTILNAAMVNAYNCHILEMDDVHKKSILHPAAPTISAAFSTAEALEKSGKDFITSIVAGYDIALRVGEAVSPSHYKYWHTTGTCGTFGSAAASAKLLDLEPMQVVYSLGNAGSQAAGLWEFINDNAMTKFLHCGKAAMNGIIASMLTKLGLTGATKILEGEQGFFKAYSSEKDYERCFEDLGKHFKINETAFKPYASCRHTHPSVDGVLDLKRKYDINPEEVESINIQTYETATKIAGNEVFYDAMSAKFSLAYCISAALCFGKLGVGEFTQNKIESSSIKDLAKKVKITVNEDINNNYPDKWQSKITIKTKQGNYETFIKYPKGDPENTLNEDEIDEKFMGLATLKISENKGREILSKCKQIEDVDSLSDFF